MNGIICYTSYLPEGEERDITFSELLLNDNWADGMIDCPERIYEDIGDINHKLLAKQKYEFLLRAVQKYPLKVVGTIAKTYTLHSEKDVWNDYCTDCYIVSKYREELLSLGFYSTAIKNLVAKVTDLTDSGEAISWLGKMIARSPEYYAIDDDVAPILIYQDNDFCCHVPASFANGLAQALRSCRQRVILWDVTDEDRYSPLATLVGKRFKAIVGIQTRVFLSTFTSGNRNGFFHDLIAGPKYNIILDHPISVRRLFDNPPDNYYVLVHDRNYQSFIKNYWPKVKDSFCFPPGGMCMSDVAIKAESINESKEVEWKGAGTSSIGRVRQYDIVFIGSCPNYRNFLGTIYNIQGSLRILAVRFLHIMRHNPDYPAEKALHVVLEEYNIKCNDTDFLNLLEMLRCVTACISSYYREKVVRALLDAGIELHVYGEDWDRVPFAEHKCLRRHLGIDVEESLRIMQQAKISLNIMSWHKDGFTEVSAK